ncbi:hypothetical protein [Burkholderia cepacia]|uniref:hypothetical protein n=1 Tax=Burkholderia cepacia TaxID=292 RepID=UPI00158EDF08|nr:hypothetical protein [Burkholderia cepacia]MCA8161026.1 hypothetical protein [Burkholderia cepacia]
MNQHYIKLVELAKVIAHEKGLPWEIPLDESGVASDGVGWNLTVATGGSPPPSNYLRHFGPDAYALAKVNEERTAQCVAPGLSSPLSTAWQDLIKAVVVVQLFVRRSSVRHVLQNFARPLRVIATCVNTEPWALTIDDMRRAVDVGRMIQAGGKLGDSIVGVVNSIFDVQHICDVGPMYQLLAVPRIKTSSFIKAKHIWSKEKLRDDLVSRKSDERLPSRRAFWELVRIVMTERPRTFMDELRFAAIRTLILTGMRVGEVALLPVDWRRERTHVDAHGKSAAESGGISTSLMIRHYAEKQQVREGDSRALYEETQYVPEMFREILTETLDRVAKLTEPLRVTLKLQCETGRILPWYPAGSLVRFVELFTHLMGNPFWLAIDREPFVERYRNNFDPSIFTELRLLQRVLRDDGARKLSPTVYQLGNRLKQAISSGETTLRLRHKDASVINSEKMDWNSVYLYVGELEEYVRRTTPTKLPDTVAMPLNVGNVEPWELMFLQPKRSVAEERNDGLCDITRYFAVGRPSQFFIGGAMDYDRRIGSLFAKYGETDEDRSLKMEPHMLRHLQNTELFRLGVADTIISKRFNRRSVAQSYEYDHRSLSEDLEHVDIPSDIEVMLGQNATTVAKLIKTGKANGPIVNEFLRIQATEGDTSAYEYLRAEADGFHATPYGHCLNSFTVDPCPKHLECFADCRHLSATDLPEQRENLIRLEGKFRAAIETIKDRPSTSIGWKNQLDHAEKRLTGVQKLLATKPGEHPFPDGVDLSTPGTPGVLDD